MTRNRNLSLLAFVFLASFSVASAARAADSRSLLLSHEDYTVYELQGLHADISLANMINGLNLTTEQLWALTEIAYQSDDVRDRYRVAMEPVMTQMRSASEELKRCLLEEGTASEGTIHAVELATRGFQDHRYDFHRELLALEDEIEAVLDENQLQLMEGTRPCVRPPDELSLVRVGQTGAAGSRLTDQLETMRDLDEMQFERRKDRFIERSLTRRDERLASGDEEAEAAHTQAMSDAIDAVYEMSDIDWAVQGPAAADRVAELMKVKPDKPTGQRPRKEHELGRASELLLAAGAADVLAAIYERRQQELAGLR